MVTDEQLSSHFWLREFCRSETWARMGLAIEPTPVIIENLRRLCTLVLEPVRVRLGQPIVITSGYRPPELNALIGGSTTSAHMDGRAADINAIGMRPMNLCRWIKNNDFDHIDQVILEFPESQAAWCHVGIAPIAGTGRNEYLTASRINGKTVYERGINA